MDITIRRLHSTLYTRNFHYYNFSSEITLYIRQKHKIALHWFFTQINVHFNLSGKVGFSRSYMTILLDPYFTEGRFSRTRKRGNFFFPAFFIPSRCDIRK